MRWLVVGSAGQLGTHLVNQLRDAGEDVVGLDMPDIDIVSMESVRHATDDAAPAVVLNAAAYTAVDAAEDDEPTAEAVNVVGPSNLAQALATTDATLVHVSTDYVFDGTATAPYEPDDPTGPRTAYGRTKLGGELEVRRHLPERGFVVRTAWVWGGPGKNFVDTMVALEQSRPSITVVSDQIGTPTYAPDLAGALIAVGRASRDGLSGRTLHFTNAGRASWFDLAQAVFSAVGADPSRVAPTDSASYPARAERPAWSVLSDRAWIAAGLPAARPWQDAVTAHFA